MAGLKSGLTYKQLREIYNLSEESLEAFVKGYNYDDFKYLKRMNQLEFIVEIRNFNQEFRNNLLKDLLYPSVLCIISFSLTLIYNQFFLPMIKSMFEVDGWIQIIAFITYIAMLVLFFVVGLFIILCFFIEYRFLIYILFHQLRLFDILKIYKTYRFVYTFKILRNLQLSTKQAIEEMRELKKMRDVSWLAYHVDERLEQGFDYQEAFNLEYFEKSFIFHFKHRVFNENLVTLDEYLIYLKSLLTVKIKRLSLIMKLINYVYISVYIGMYYLLILQPVRILEGLL